MLIKALMYLGDPFILNLNFSASFHMYLLLGRFRVGTLSLLTWKYVLWYVKEFQGLSIVREMCVICSPICLHSVIESLLLISVGLFGSLLVLFRQLFLCVSPIPTDSRVAVQKLHELRSPNLLFPLHQQESLKRFSSFKRSV